VMFDFRSRLSAAAVSEVVPFLGFPPFHFVGGNIDEPTVPAEALADAVGRVLRNQGHAMGKYGMNNGPQGYLPLRECISASLQKRAGMTVSTDEILLTSGSLQAMDLVNKALLDRGDIVLVEASNYAGTLTKLDALGVEYLGIDLDENGMRMDLLRQALEDLAAQNRIPKYIFTIPTVQNPTGTIMPVERRREMLALSKQYDVPIFEDDCYADLVFSGQRPPGPYPTVKDGCGKWRSRTDGLS